MTPEQIRLIQESFKKVQPIADQAAALFYDRLFTIDPSLRPLFKGDMKEQGRKLMTTLGLVVAGLERLDKLVPVVRELGQRHEGYGVQPGHYHTVSAALLWTLEQGLGADFTAEVRHAWAAAYNILAAIMIEAGAQRNVRASA
jgi:hemoglobin-like flavoprotein